MNRTIVRIIVFLLAFLPMPNAFSQEGEGNPYACFGDESPVRDIARQTEVSETRVFIVLSDTVRAEIHIEGDRLTVIDTGGKERSTYKIDFSSRALFSAPDPKANEMPWVSPYVYCFGNPIHFIDETGERPSAYEAAMMAEVVYDKNIRDKELPKDLASAQWSISNFNTSIQMNYTGPSDCGLQSILFERTVDGVTEYAYVFAGTYSLEDAVEDVAQLVGLAPQYKMAIHNARTLSTELGNHELTFVGHSMGAGEAAASSMATGRAAISFNPAVVSPFTCWFNGVEGRGDIVNYISSTPEIAGMHFTSDPVTNLQKLRCLIAPGSHIPVPIGFYPSHSISPLVNALKPR